MLYAIRNLSISKKVMADIPLAMQTAYADLLDRCANAAFEAAFSEAGSFVSKTARGRTYWYFQTTTAEGRNQKYVGPETPELLERIKHHKEARNDERDRRAIVSSLVRSAYLPAPQKKIGEVINALATAGVFRLRGMMVGTSAYQTYSAMLGTRLPLGSMQTSDVDVAQYMTVSVALEDTTPPMLDVLKAVDPSFRAIPDTLDGRRSTNYAADSGIRVDFLTPNQGADTSEPRKLPALNTDGVPLRFLDFLIHEPEPAVILHGSGIYVYVPNPHRYALHKLIVAQRRRVGDPKKTKDIIQAEALLKILVGRQRKELRHIWEEAWSRGKRWREHLGEGLAEIEPDIRDRVLQVVDGRRSLIPGLDLQFYAPQARYDFDRDVVTFLGEAGSREVRCAISREALDDHFGADGLDKEGRLKRFRENRETIENMMREKFLNLPVQEIGGVLIKSKEVPILMKNLRA